jgi:hypothetical protein
VITLKSKYAGQAYKEGACRCGAHRLHKVLRFAWENPSASRKECAKYLKLSEENVRAAFFLLRKRDPARLCPECFRPALLGGVCQNCGFEPSAPSLPLEVMPDSQSPTNHIHAGSLLGSVTDYAAIGFTNHPLVISRRIDRGVEESLIRGVKSDVENELKRSFPSEAITDEAGRLCLKEVFEFRQRYPGLASSKNVRRQLAENVIARLRFLHPQLRPVTPLHSEVVA